MQQHYVYLITEKSSNKKYIGSRSSYVAPEEDLGIKYFSSSSVKSFIANQKQNPSDYSYTILSTHESRVSANDEEYRLLKANDVVRSTKFYNRAITKGGIFEEVVGTKGIVPCRNKLTNEFIKLPREEFLVNKDLYEGIHKPTGASNPRAKTIELYNHKNELMYTVKGNLKNLCEEHNMPYPAFCLSHRNGGKKLGLNSNSRGELRKRNKQYYIGWYALIKGETRTDLSEPDCDCEIERYVGPSSKILSRHYMFGSYNGNAKRINIYNAEGALQYECFGNFDDTVKEHGLPPVLQDSYLKNRRIHTKLVSSPFHNWYATLVK